VNVVINDMNPPQMIISVIFVYSCVMHGGNGVRKRINFGIHIGYAYLNHVNESLMHL